MSCVPALKRGNDPSIVFCGPRLSEVDFTQRAFCMARNPLAGVKVAYVLFKPKMWIVE